MESSERKMLQLVDQNRTLAEKLRRALERDKDLEERTSEANQMKVQLEQTKYESQMKITEMAAELEELKRQAKPQ